MTEERPQTDRKTIKNATRIDTHQVSPRSMLVYKGVKPDTLSNRIYYKSVYSLTPIISEDRFGLKIHIIIFPILANIGGFITNFRIAIFNSISYIFLCFFLCVPFSFKFMFTTFSPESK